MDIAVPSRFSCLHIEDDDFKPVVNKNAKKKEKKPTNQINKKPAKQQPISSQGKKKNKAKNDTKQWEEWQRKDNEMVNDNFEQDLQSAILQSQLDYEKQLRNPAVLKISEVPSKKKKSKTMSLDQFLEEKNGNGSNKADIEEKEDGRNFFNDIAETGKKEIIKENIKIKRKERESNIDERISLAQIQEKLEKERSVNEVLRKELEEAKSEIAVVKKRNATLCSMLSQGEMKDKAAVLVELEKLTLVKEELTEEVGRLHKLLEQERSKSDNNNKNKEKKNKKK